LPCTDAAHRAPPPLVSSRAGDRPHGPKREEVCPMRGSNLIWTIVGVLLIIALVIFILGRV